MKRIILITLMLLVYNFGFAQRMLEWSIGEIEITCGEAVQISYPLMVSINNESNDPSLGTTTMRIFYDGNLLENISIKNIQNGYTKSGLNQSNPVFGDVFGFSSVEGIFLQFNLIDNAATNPINLSEKPTHVLDFSFTVASDATYPLITPIVFDNNIKGRGLGQKLDSGYLVNDAGIVGTYFLDGDTQTSILADDEVINYLWSALPSFAGRVDKFEDKAGKKVELGNGIEDVCGMSDDAKHKLFTIYPVPFNGEVAVKYSFEYETDVTIEVFDLKGALILKVENKNYRKGVYFEEMLDLSNTSDQLFLVKLTSNRSVAIKKIVSSSLKSRN